jgi:glycerol-3-phosphate dehydrogenase
LGSAGHPGTEALQICAKTMQEEMGWSLARMQQELEEVNKVYELWDE